MKKLFTVFVLTVISVIGADAQNNSTKSLSIGAELGLPTGDLSNMQKAGAGISAKMAFPVVANGAFTASLGYLGFGGKSINLLGISYSNPSWSMVPVKLGFRYKIPGTAVNVEPQLGYTFGSRSGSPARDVSGVTWALGAGYYFTPSIDLGLRYESFSVSGGSLNFIGLRLAYNFNIGDR